MGGSHTGGGGSVQWSYDVKDLKRQSSDHPPNGRYALTGADEGGREDTEYFTISIALPPESIPLPPDQKLERFTRTLRVQGNRVEFDLLIRRDSDQINIRWPDKPVGGV